jgi:adenosine kinase
VLMRVAVRITTHGADGAVIAQPSEADVRVPVVPAASVADPTGVGDAFRAGLLSARSWGLSWERAAQVGSLLATLCLETTGTQEYSLDRDDALNRLGTAYGAAAAEEIAPHLPTH